MRAELFGSPLEVLPGLDVGLGVDQGGGGEERGRLAGLLLEKSSPCERAKCQLTGELARLVPPEGLLSEQGEDQALGGGGAWHLAVALEPLEHRIVVALERVKHGELAVVAHPQVGVDVTHVGEAFLETANGGVRAPSHAEGDDPGQTNVAPLAGAGGNNH